MNRSSPSSPDALFAQAAALHQGGRLAEAQALYQRILAMAPHHVNALTNLGTVFLQTGQHAECAQTLRHSLELAPDQPGALGNLGLALLTLKDYPAALASLERAVALRPDHPGFHFNHGLALRALGDLPQAQASFARAVALKPDYADAHLNLGIVLTELEQPTEALESYERAAQLKPDAAGIWYNRGIALLDLERREAALDSFERAVALAPDHADAQLNRAFLLLERGDFARGWPLYEWRWRTAGHAALARRFAQPQWQGEDPRGKTILLHAEQGLGDTVQFSRYAPLLMQRGAKVILEVQPPLVELLTSLNPAPSVVARGADLPPFDLHCPLPSLPLAFAGSLENLPAPPAYLAVAEERRLAWAARLGSATRPRIGLAWAGAAIHPNDHRRSIAAAELAPLWQSDGEFHCLHKEFRPGEREALPAQVSVWAEHLHDFTDTAALVAAMDVVVSVDTSVAHLAAALGKPTWILLGQRSDFRWLRDRQDSRWYPSARLFRQGRDEPWRAVIERVVAALGV